MLKLKMNSGLVLPLALLVALGACGKKKTNDDDVPAAAAADVPDVGSVPDAAAGDGDMQEVRDYTLSVDDVQKWATATRSLKKIQQAHPEIADVDCSSCDVAAWENQIERVPGASAAIDDAGLSTHEYAVIGWAVIQAASVSAASKPGDANEKDLIAKTGVNPANVRFWREHGAQLQQLLSDEG